MLINRKWSRKHISHLFSWTLQVDSNDTDLMDEIKRTCNLVTNVS